MNEQYIVLRATKAKPKVTFRSATAKEPGSVSDVNVQVVETDTNGINKIRKEKNVYAVAPRIPMKLIKALKSARADAAIAGQISWGVKAVGADTSTLTGKGIKVAVLDTGIKANHPAFAGVNILSQDFTGEGVDDTDGHGSHCAGTILGRDVDKTRIGIARGVTDLLVGKVIGADGGSSETIVSAIQWAISNGANVISMSLGMDFPGYQKQLEEMSYPPELATSMALEGFRKNVLLFERLASFTRQQSLGGFAQPLIIVAAAGNESQRDVSPNFEIAVSPPAIAEGIFSVGALGMNGADLKIADFSNSGPILSAPGVDISSVNIEGGLIAFSGTSMAAPHVAGVAALWAEKLGVSKDPQPTLMNQWITRLNGSCLVTRLQNESPENYGLGLVMAPQR